MDLDPPGEVVASIIRERFFENSKAIGVSECSSERHVKYQTLAALAGSPCLAYASKEFPGHYGGYGLRSPLMDAIEKTVIAQAELRNNFFVKCRQCGEMIRANVDDIEEHSSVCLPIKCRQCGQTISADIDAIEAHSAVCLPIIDVQSARCQHPDTCEDPQIGLAQMEACVPRALHCGISDIAVGHALRDVSAANLACLSQGLQRGCATMPLLHLHPVEDAIQRDERLLPQLRQEVRRQIEALRAQQLVAASHSPVQVVIDNHATVSAHQTQMHEEVHHTPVGHSEAWWRDFLTSSANHSVLISVALLSLYFADGYLNHSYRLAELQHRIDANAILRFQQILCQQLKGML